MDEWQFLSKTDPRFSNIRELVHKYARAIPISDDERENVKEELYRVIMILKGENRITGEFELKPPNLSLWCQKPLTLALPSAQPTIGNKAHEQAGRKVTITDLNQGAGTIWV